MRRTPRHESTSPTSPHSRTEPMARARPTHLALLVAFLATGCGDAATPAASDAGPRDAATFDASPGDASADDAASPDADAPDANLADAALLDAAIVDAGPPPAPTGNIPLEACRGEGGIDERCTLVTDASACTGARCAKLVVVFSGGERGCVSGAGYARVLAGYAAQGYAAVCINYFETSMGSGTLPYVDEAARLDLAVREATTGAWARSYWTGDDLLLQGISHGASAPVILMARTRLDEQPHWRGSRFTAGCFFDGTYDQAATARLLETGAIGGSPCTTPVSWQRWLERYCGPGATGATCDLTTERKAVEDSITDVLPATFALRDLKLIECGSNLRACIGDIVPAAPIEALCTRLDAAPAHTCTFASLPDDSHLSCHADRYDDCRTWFEGLLPP